MSRYEYLKSLEGYLLKYLTREEVNDILRDYGEYFSEGEQTGKSEAQIIAELGDPQAVARQIILESKPGTPIDFKSGTEKAKRAADEAVSFFKTPSGKLVFVVLVILTVPVWFSAVGTVLGALLTIFGVLLAMLCLGGVFVIGGVVLIGGSLICASSVPASVIALAIAAALAMIAGGVFGIAIMIMLAKLLFKILIKLKNMICDELHIGSRSKALSEVEKDA